MKISELNPKRVFSFFSDIAAIPRGSGNTEGIAEYCVKFARERGLECYKDEGGNVMIFKNGTPGYENSRTVILQGHLDMVCEKEPDCMLDMEKEGVRVRTDGEYVWAEGTTLGGDDGIAVAYILALLDSDDIPHPPIEALLTADEEIGLIGAKNLDASRLVGKRVINIDSEKEGVITVSCAGGVRAYCELPLTFCESNSSELCAFEIEIDGLLGGHSGVDIDKNRKNAAKLMGRLLEELRRELGISISRLASGGRVNVIPKTAGAVVCADKKLASRLKSIVKDFEAAVKSECSDEETHAAVRVRETEVPENHTDSDGTDKLIFALLQIPDGIQVMNPHIKGMVRTSLNLGNVLLDGNALKMGFLIRSNIATEKQMMVRRLSSFIEYIGGSITLEADYPAWEYKAESPLREIAGSAFEELYGTSPKIEAIHAGLECGILSEKIDGADIVSFGPDIENVHTPKERMNVRSVERCWKYLLKILENSKEVNL
ncbi:MAG: aminoacyl-histidine dipeptidase [Clostridia bacterium]